MKKILVTGFEPFGGEEINPSWEAVKSLPSKIKEYSLTKLQLPVVFGEAARMVLDTAERICPDVILCIGQAGGRAEITPELVAINIRHAQIPDNIGNQPEDEPILEGAPAAYFSTIPVRKIAEVINAQGIASKVSYSAGAYVCNDLLYTLLARYAASATRVGFIHVPYSTDQGKTPSMELEKIIDALVIAIENLK